MLVPEEAAAQPEPGEPPRGAGSVGASVDANGSFRQILTQPAFRLIWLAQLAAQLADKFVMFSLVILAYRVSRGSTPVAFTLLAYTLPAIAIAPLAGVFADRHDRKRIMWSTNLGRGLIVALIPVAAWFPAPRNDFWHLMAITFAFSVAGQFFSPAEAAVIPNLLSKRALLTANSLVMVTLMLTLLLGGALSPVLTQFSLYAPYWWGAFLFVLAGALVLMAPIPRLGSGSQPGPGHPFRRMVAEVLEGIDYLRGSQVLLASFLQLALAVLVMYMMFTLAPAYVSTVIQLPTQETYLILVPATLGAMVGAGLLIRFGRHLAPRRQMSLSLIATGATLVVLALAPSFLGADHRYLRLFAAAVSALLGLEFGAMIIPPVTNLMVRTVDEVRGRIFALLYMVVNGAIALPVLAAAALSDALGTGRVIAALGVVLAVAGLVMRQVGRRRPAG